VSIIRILGYNLNFQIVVSCKAEEGGDAVASSTDDNAADGGKMEILM